MTQTKLKIKPKLSAAEVAELVAEKSRARS
jgi:hypothetical protein